VIKNESYRKVLEGIGQVQEVKFCSVKLLFPNLLKLKLQPDTQTIIYDIRYNLSKCLDLEQKTKKK